MIAKRKADKLIKTRGVRLMVLKGHHKATVAVARRLAMAMYAMRRDGTEFQLDADGPMPAGEAYTKVRRLIGVSNMTAA